MKTILVLPAWGQSKKEWALITDKINYNVVIFDLPGFGNEPKIMDGWGVPEYAEWVTKKVEGLHLNDIVIIGHSFGGRVAALIASTNPKWLSGLILYCAPCLFRPSISIKFKGLVAGGLKKLGIKLKVFKNPHLDEAKEMGLEKTFRKTVVFDQTNFLPKIKTRTFIIAGENDLYAPLAIQSEMSKLIPNADLMIIDKGSHFLHLDNQNIFYGSIKRFIENL